MLVVSDVFANELAIGSDQSLVVWRVEVWNSDARSRTKYVPFVIEKQLTTIIYNLLLNQIVTKPTEVH